MSQTPLLTGQDIAEASGAVEIQLERVLGPTGTTRHEYVVLRVLAARQFESPASLREYLASQRQLGLTPPTISTLLTGLNERGLTTGTADSDPGPAQLTPGGADLLRRLAETVAPTTRSIFAGIDAEDLATAHRVLRQVIEHAARVGD